jgi:hypothetical protein
MCLAAPISESARGCVQGAAIYSPGAGLARGWRALRLCCRARVDAGPGGRIAIQFPMDRPRFAVRMDSFVSARIGYLNLVKVLMDDEGCWNNGCSSVDQDAAGRERLLSKCRRSRVPAADRKAPGPAPARLERRLSVPPTASRCVSPVRPECLPAILRNAPPMAPKRPFNGLRGSTSGRYRARMIPRSQLGSVCAQLSQPRYCVNGQSRASTQSE